MTTRERNDLLRLIADPPPGSKLAAAKEFGIDLTLLVRRLGSTPNARLRSSQPLKALSENSSGRGNDPMNDFERSLKALHAGGIDFVVIGGVALAIQGSAHLTYDLDVCYDRDPENMQRLAEALTPYHPRLRDVGDEVPFVFDAGTIARGLNFTLTTDLGDLDLFGEVTGIGLYDQVLALSVQHELFGWPCRVLSIQGLIRAKRATGRTKDLLVLPELEALQELETRIHTASGSSQERRDQEFPEDQNIDGPFRKV